MYGEDVLLFARALENNYHLPLKPIGPLSFELKEKILPPYSAECYACRKNLPHTPEQHKRSIKNSRRS